eukprot:maker-scaffold311_size212931-snap-gene-1.16 protein:Tk00660 transcript:maker-scaffold311_size212931-snap-gene-1.16-mRNA-1 annotation:"hypothetical protein ETSY2_36450"
MEATNTIDPSEPSENESLLNHPLAVDPQAVSFQSLVVLDDPDSHRPIGSAKAETHLVIPLRNGVSSPGAAGGGSAKAKETAKRSRCPLDLSRNFNFRKAVKGDRERSNSNCLMPAQSYKRRCCPCVSRRFDGMSGSRLFLIQAVVVWSLLCLPGNLVTIVLHFRVGSKSLDDLMPLTPELMASAQANETDLLMEDMADSYDGPSNHLGPAWEKEIKHLPLFRLIFGADGAALAEVASCFCANVSTEETSRLADCISVWDLRLAQAANDTSFCSHDFGEGVWNHNICSNSRKDAKRMLWKCPHLLNTPNLAGSNVTSSRGELSCYELHSEYNYFLDSSKFWLEGVGICVVGICGLCGNFLTIVVLRKSETNRPFNKLLICLAIADNLLIFVSIGETAIVGTFMNIHPTWYKLCYPYLLHPLKGMVQTATIFMVVAVSAERYKAVCHPLSHRHAPFKFVLMVIFTSIGLELPRFFQFRLVNNGTHIDFWTTTLMEDPTYIQFSSYWDEIVITGAVPLAALIYFNLCMILKIRASNKFSHRFVGQRDSPPLETTFEHTQTMVGGNEFGEGTEMATLKEPVAVSLKRSLRRSMRRSFLKKPINSGEAGKKGPAVTRSPSIKEHHFDAISTDGGTTSNHIHHSLSVRKSRRSNAHHFQKRREKSTMILVLIVLIFMACHCYRLALKVYEFVNPHTNTAEHFNHCLNQQRYHIPMIFYVLGHIHHLVLVLNSSINFIIYCCVGKEFRSRLSTSMDCVVAPGIRDQMLVSWHHLRELGLLPDNFPGSGGAVQVWDSVEAIKSDFDDVFSDTLKKATSGMKGEPMNIKLRDNVPITPLHVNFMSATDLIKRVDPRSRWFCKIDAVHGYFQVPLDFQSAPLTCFLLCFGRFMYGGAPMGLNSSSDFFNRKSDMAVLGLLWLLKIVDDMLVQAETLEQLLVRIRIVLERCRQHGITVSLKKFEIGQSILFAGADGITSDPSKLKAIREFPATATFRVVRSFLGLVNQLAFFDPNLAHHTASIQELTKKGVTFQWLPVQQRDFESLKKRLCSDRLVKPFNVCLPTKLLTGASRLHGLGFALVQQGPDGHARLIQAGSRTLSVAEKNYATVELELLAVSWGVEKSSFYLKGIASFVVFTDHKPRLGLMSKDLQDIGNERLQRLRQRLIPFNFTIDWRAGEAHKIADALSRAPVDVPTAEDKSHMDSLSVVSGLLVLDGHRIVVPPQARPEMVRAAHKAHLGQQYSYYKAKETLFWPLMKRDIISYVEKCQEFRSSLPLEPFDMSEEVSALMANVSMDLIEAAAAHWLVLVDRFSGVYFLVPLEESCYNPHH